MGFSFESEDAKRLNKEIFETIYFAALTASKDLAIKDGSYSSFAGSPASKGTLQFDMWNIDEEEDLSGRWNWNELKESIVKNGLRNSTGFTLLILN